MWKDKYKRLRAIYDRFEKEVSQYKENAICKLGCTYCCTDVGNVDINTLEGLMVWERINSFAPEQKHRIRHKLDQNKRQKEQGRIARCPFLGEDGACLIYDIRPFSCRQLYSVRECRGQGPTVHRQAVTMAKKAVRDMQGIDDTGYSGHLSFILYLLDKANFRTLYVKGGFDPGRIMKFGKSHGIIINRYAR
jgi:hypothetical protein